MAKKELKEQLKSYEGYINDIPYVISPCKMCKVYKQNGEQWKYKKCRFCCWFYDSKFEIGEE